MFKRQVRACIEAIVPSLLCLSPTLCLANLLPESTLLIHVQPVGGTCETAITVCEEIVRTTEADGPLEFLIFFSRMLSWSGQHLCIRSVDADLVWPERWEFVEFSPCFGWGEITHDGSTHSIHLSSVYGAAIPDTEYGIVRVGRLVLNVQGPGRLDFASVYGQAELVSTTGSSCIGSAFMTPAVGIDAEAGMDCEYTTVSCGWNEACVPRFDPSQLVLSTFPGGGATGEVECWATGYGGESCPLTIDTRAAWLEAEIVPDVPRARLLVTADATGLPEGVYETQIQVVPAAWYGVARCLPVQLRVSLYPSPVYEATWGEIKAIYH